MGCVLVLLCGAAAYLLYRAGAEEIVFYIAVINAGANLWSYGILHNYRDDPVLAPNSWTAVNMVTAFIGLGLLIYSFFA